MRNKFRAPNGYYLSRRGSLSIFFKNPRMNDRHRCIAKITLINRHGRKHKVRPLAASHEGRSAVAIRSVFGGNGGDISLLPEGARNSPGLPPVGAGGPCPGGPVRNSGGPPPAPGGGYSPATATAAAMPAKLAGSRPVRNRLRTALRGDRIRPAISETGCHNYRGAYLLDSRFIIITRDSGRPASR